MSRLTFSIFLLLFGQFILAQSLNDDFSDGNLQDPTYLGDTDDFVVQNEQLRLMAPAAGSSFLFLPVQTDASQTVIYELFAQLEFSPSSSNFAELRFAGLGPSGEAVSYALKIGGISGDQDALVFSATVDGTEQTLISGTAGAVGQDTARARIRLVRSATNNWTLLADYSGGDNFSNEGSSADPLGMVPAQLTEFGIFCNYTATRVDKFAFDDLLIEPILVDETPPLLLAAEITSNNSVDLIFNEALAGAAIEEATNYTTNLPTLSVQNASLNGARVALQFNNNIPAGEQITITANTIEDLSGNPANDLSADIFIPITTTPSARNLLITEFMADPTPEVGLPNAEFVEIYNRGDTVLDLTGLTIASGGAGVPINGNLNPGQYLVLSRPDVIDEFPPGTNTQAISLPALSNGGDVILLSFSGQFLQQIDYTDSWYKDPIRESGGFSLELTDLSVEDPNCEGLWGASQSPIGGTPGGLNSIDGEILDNLGPQLLAATFTNGNVRMTFSESLDIGSVVGNISIEPSLGATQIITENPTTYILVTQEDPVENTLYLLTAEAELQDCVGNFSDSVFQVQLGLASEVAVGDVVINEILFNPVTGGSDFVEIYNCSDKILNVDGWVLANTLAATGSPFESIDADRLLLPNGYLVFTEDPENILAVYEQAQAAFLIDNDLPSLPNDLGNISLISPSGDTLDSYDYDEDQHSALLDDVNGVSLERINPKAATQQTGNWFSAASRVGFGTPTQENSQRRDGIMNPDSEGFFSLTEDTFSPNGDGFQDVLFLNYNTPGPGWNARITIYDANGRLIRTLRRAELLAGEGSILWDGTNDDLLRARTGIYVLLIERFSPDGGTANEKLVAVLVNE